MSLIPQVPQEPIPVPLLSSSLLLGSSFFPCLKSRHTHSFQCLLQAAKAALLLVLVGEGRHLLSLLLVPRFLRLHSRRWNLLLILPLHDFLKAPLIQGACRLDWSWGNDRQRKGAALNQEGLTETVVPPHTLALN